MKSDAPRTVGDEILFNRSLAFTHDGNDSVCCLSQPKSVQLASDECHELPQDAAAIYPSRLRSGRPGASEACPAFYTRSNAFIPTRSFLQTESPRRRTGGSHLCSHASRDEPRCRRAQTLSSPVLRDVCAHRLLWYRPPSRVLRESNDGCSRYRPTPSRLSQQDHLTCWCQ